MCQNYIEFCLATNATGYFGIIQVMSTAVDLQTNNPNVKLIKPDIERDAALGVQWLGGDSGKATLSLMGVADKDNEPTTIEHERERVGDFIKRQDQINWMIEYRGKVVGSVWVNLEQVGSVPAPAVHIMIGDPSVRGKGIGFAATSKVIEYLEAQGFRAVYSRRLIKNSGASGLLQSLGFAKFKESYTDKDGLEWQDLKKELKAK